MRALIEIGEPEEALLTYYVLGGDAAKTHEYIDALIKPGSSRLLLSCLHSLPHYQRSHHSEEIS